MRSTFIEKIGIGDETWVKFVDVKTKNQTNRHWVHNNVFFTKTELLNEPNTWQEN